MASRTYKYTEEQPKDCTDRHYSINIDDIQSVEDIKEFLNLLNLRVDFKNESLITEQNKHLITVQEYGEDY